MIFQDKDKVLLNIEELTLYDVLFKEAKIKTKVEDSEANTLEINLTYDILNIEQYNALTK